MGLHRIFSREFAKYQEKGLGKYLVQLCQLSGTKAAVRAMEEGMTEIERGAEERTAELRKANEMLEREIAVRKRTESVIMARLRLLQFAGTHSLDELLQATLDEAEALTGSLIGFYHFLGADQETLSLQNWSTRTKAEFCKAEGKGRHYDISAAGVWVDCIRQRYPVIHNDYASLPHRKGMPPGHAQVVRELVVPVFRGDKIVSILGVGNKTLDYTPEDVETISLLADLAWEITERKRMEEKLLLSHFCINKAAIGIYHTTFEGNILSANDFACRSLGYTADELCALKIPDIDPVITYEKTLEIKRMLDETGSVTHETVHRRKDGTTFPVEIVTNSLEFQGNSYGYSFVKDITERKLAEEELKRQKQLLEELNETLENRVEEEVAKNREKDSMLIQQNRQAALGEMLDHIAHQWKQPLNSIALIIQYMRETASDGELTDELVEVTVSKTMALLEHMAQTIDVFRGFYRPDKEKKVFSVKDSINQALAFIAPAFKFQSIAAELDVDPELTAFGYPKEFAQVLLNILANTRDAFKARETEKPKVIIRAFSEDTKTVVTIADNAGGIPESIKDKIFDFNFTTNESSGGTGIGLYMSKNIIEKNMSGTLSAKNTDDGAQFRIEIHTT
jgi:PAS domain S-box-containing protein